LQELTERTNVNLCDARLPTSSLRDNGHSRWAVPADMPEDDANWKPSADADSAANMDSFRTVSHQAHLANYVEGTLLSRQGGARETGPELVSRVRSGVARMMREASEGQGSGEWNEIACGVWKGGFGGADPVLGLGLGLGPALIGPAVLVFSHSGVMGGISAVLNNKTEYEIVANSCKNTQVDMMLVKVTVPPNGA
jgi:hypothetical protein